MALLALNLPETPQAFRQRGLTAPPDQAELSRGGSRTEPPRRGARRGEYSAAQKHKGFREAWLGSVGFACSGVEK